MMRDLSKGVIASALMMMSLPHAIAAPGQPDSYAAFEKSVEEAKTAMMADPEHALDKADQAIARAHAVSAGMRQQVALATAEWLKGEALIQVNRIADATPVVSSALRRVAKAAANTKLHGDLLRSHGAIAAMDGHVQEALGDFHQAYRIFTRANEVRSRAIALQDIGQIYWEAADYPTTLRYYSEAAGLYAALKQADPAFHLTAHNSRAEVLRKLNRLAEAERDYQEALRSAQMLESPLLQARVLSNLAAAQVENGKVAEAQRSVDQALRLSRSGEAAGWRPMVLGVAAMVAAARNDWRNAATLIDRTFAGADFATTPMPFKEFHEAGAEIFERVGNRDAALRHLKAFQRLDSEARKLTASASAQLMSARFDSTNKDLKISQLTLQRQKREAEFRTTVLIGIMAAVLIVFALLLVSALRIRRSRNEVRAANVVLNDTNVALEKALKSKTEFLATTSHEIRTPLNGILGMTQIILANNRVDGEVRGQIELVHGAGEAVKALVDDILDVAKMETGIVSIVKQDVDLRQILTDTAQLWGAQAESKGLSLTLDMEAAPRRVMTDGSRLRQILFNLMANAVKFTDRGSVALRVATVESDAGERLVFVVSDTGIGIPEDQHDTVFEAFHQVDGGTTRRFGGTGLGLAICRNLAGALGGSMALESTPGIGSTFTVSIPLEHVSTNVSTLPFEPQERPEQLAGTRLLVLEANLLAQGMINALLAPVVQSIEAVVSAKEAIHMAEDGRCDHMLIDAQSAVADSPEPLDALREIIATAAARGVVTTVLLAVSDELPLGEVAVLGASQLVLKPVGGAALIDTLHGAYDARVVDPNQDEIAHAA